MGKWDESDELLAKWVHIGGFPIPEILRQINGDGRFALFHKYRRNRFIPPSLRGKADLTAAVTDLGTPLGTTY